jgi:hypothetical protein
MMGTLKNIILRKINCYVLNISILFGVYFAQLSVARKNGVELKDERGMLKLKDQTGRGSCLIEVLYRNSFGQTEDTTKNQCQDRKCTSQVPNRVLPIFETRSLPLLQPLRYTYRN